MASTKRSSPTPKPQATMEAEAGAGSRQKSTFEAPRRSRIGNQAMLRRMQAAVAGGIHNDSTAERYENEANAIADSFAPPSRSRALSKNAVPSVAPDATERLQQRRSGGVPIPGHTRERMETAFGADFGGVRLHLDTEAFQLARQLHAKAFTYGSDIYFSAGRYRPETAAGERLLAHELTHAVQQQSREPTVQRDEEDEAFDPRSEMLTITAFERRYPDILGRLNDLVDAITILNDNVMDFGPRGFPFTELFERYQRSYRLWEEAEGQLDRTYSIVRVMAAVARAESVCVRAYALIRAQQREARTGLTADVPSPLTRPLAEANQTRNALQRALSSRREVRRVHEVVREEIEAERVETAAREERARATRPIEEVEASLRRYVGQVQRESPEIASNETQFSLGVANLLHGELGNASRRYIELFNRLESQSPDLYRLVLFHGTMIGHLENMGVSGLATHVYREADRAGAHVLLGAWDFDPANGEERDSPGWTLLFDVGFGVIPYVGQALDVRDVAGFMYRLGRYPEQRESILTWVGLVGTLIGFIPLAGDTGKSLLSSIRRAADGVPLTRLEDVVSRIASHLPDGTLTRIADSSDEIAHALTRRWTAIQGHALNLWARLVRRLGDALTVVSDMTRAELDLMRRAAADHLPEALRLAGNWLGEFIRRWIVRTRLAVAHTADDLMGVILEYRSRWQLTTRAAEELWSPTARFLAHLTEEERAAVRAILLERAADEGSDVLAGVRRVVDDIPSHRASSVADDVPHPTRAAVDDAEPLATAVEEAAPGAAMPEVRYAGSQLPPTLEVPHAGAGSWYNMGPLDEYGRATWIDAVLNESDLSRARRGRLPDPPGWESGLDYNRTHLGAHELGFPPDRRNVTTAAREVNTFGNRPSEGMRDLRPPNMRAIEMQVVEALRHGQTVRYRVVPIYSGSAPMPVAYAMQAEGSSGLSINTVIRGWTHHE